MVLGFRIWVLKVKDVVGHKPFLFGDLPEDLRERSPFTRAKYRGYLTEVGEVRRPGEGIAVKIWKVSEDLPRWAR